MLKLQPGEMLLPGQDLLITPGENPPVRKNMLITNKSLINTELRVQIRYSYTDHLNPTEIYDNEIYNDSSALAKYISIVFAPNWSYDSADKCYHYIYQGTTSVLPSLVSPDSFTFEAFESITLRSDTLDERYSGASFTAKLIFQAKQSSFVTWETLGTADLLSLSLQP